MGQLGLAETFYYLRLAEQIYYRQVSLGAIASLGWTFQPGKTLIDLQVLEAGIISEVSTDDEISRLAGGLPGVVMRANK